jgi:hypothetical protein
MDTIASMRAFVAVAKTGSFRAAGQKLDIVPSVVTKRVIISSLRAVSCVPVGILVDRRSPRTRVCAPAR